MNYCVLSVHSGMSIVSIRLHYFVEKLKPDTYDGGAPLREFFRAIQSHRPREPLGRGNKDRCLGFVFARQNTCSIGKHAKFRELTIRRVKVEIGDVSKRRITKRYY